MRRKEDDNRALKAFIAKVADSFVKIELIRFFYHNPHFLGTVQDISLAIGRNPAKVSKGMEELVAAEIIQKKGERGGAIWSYRPDRAGHQKVALFIEAYERSDLRQWIVNEVIRRGK